MVTTHIITTSMITGSDREQQTVFVTRTSVINSESTSSSSSSASNSLAGNSQANQSTARSNSGLSGGAIAGIVVGVICGVLAIAALILFLLWRRHKHNQEPDLEETKQYQPYSFGDADANPIIAPIGGSGSTWRRPSRNDLGSNDTNSISYGVPNGATTATGSLSASNSLNRGSVTNIFAPEDSNTNHNNNGALNLQSHPSTVFEEPPLLYQGNQRFSTGSLPDMMEERHLRVVNPDDSRSRLGEKTGEANDDEIDDEDFNFISTGSSRDSPIDHEPKE